MKKTPNFYQPPSTYQEFSYHAVPAGVCELSLPSGLSPKEVYKFVTELAKDDMTVNPRELDYYYNHLNASDKKIFENLFREKSDSPDKDIGLSI